MPKHNVFDHFVGLTLKGIIRIKESVSQFFLRLMYSQIDKGMNLVNVSILAIVVWKMI